MNDATGLTNMTDADGTPLEPTEQELRIGRLNHALGHPPMDLQHIRVLKPEQLKTLEEELEAEKR